MALDEDTAWVLWPEYFDRSRPRSRGRKVKKGLAVVNPTVDMISAALRQLGLQHKVEREKRYPANWFSSGGRVLVERTGPKSQLVLKVGELLASAQRS
ncbi:MAG TPA: signal recognition particle subunit SRP19/SEC65 family protein [Methanomassiliicoccales archaeon]|jgi:signal recognition particle subunit SRP19|nr:signal recognition particle subunit SRP19/SEC65 family protein [Euryarchaeota archaeon]HOE53477.1 signal recognition particle subunit SRP19/SEC65 family protein [Methanomassiliicoccales archaeon]HOO03299.1 signal recognition particle subunit SRP19/SEC65 family protein [Methanomassiliicoccales archaeon]HQM66285.1 signal recognition particle subunit SRP19/SEC65 family protein [Methanomassiliicoccales archaeon]HRR66309.1 signal recognition particle subunit SRP19/SEC65 family protein [Methanomas